MPGDAQEGVGSLHTCRIGAATPLVKSVPSLTEPHHAPPFLASFIGAQPPRQPGGHGRLTRNRTGRDGVPTALMAEHYAQRASAGLIMSEVTCISPQAVGYPLTLGI